MSAQVIVDIKEEPEAKISIIVEPVITKSSTPKEIAIAKLIAAVVNSRVEAAAELDKQDEKGGKK